MTQMSDNVPRLVRAPSNDADAGSARPMLARDADATFWMARYVERAEHVARLLLVNSETLTDVGDLSMPLVERHWRSVLEITGSGDLPPGRGPVAQRVPHYMVFDPDNPNSIVRCLTRARENARGIREAIPSEMWESLNTLYWSIRGDDRAAAFNETPDALYREIIGGSMLFQGLTDQTLAHGQRWHFAQLGKYFERITVTCRVLKIKCEMIEPFESASEAPLWNVHWSAVLRSCGSIDAFRRTHMGEMDLEHVAQFLVLNERFPRSVRYCVQRAHEAITAIRQAVRPRTVDPAERILGRLSAQLEYADPADVLAQGLPAYLGNILGNIAEAAIDVQRSFFLH